MSLTTTTAGEVATTGDLAASTGGLITYGVVGVSALVFVVVFFAGFFSLMGSQLPFRGKNIFSTPLRKTKVEVADALPLQLQLRFQL